MELGISVAMAMTFNAQQAWTVCFKFEVNWTFNDIESDMTQTHTHFIWALYGRIGLQCNFRPKYLKPSMSSRRGSIVVIATGIPAFSLERVYYGIAIYI